MSLDTVRQIRSRYGTPLGTRHLAFLMDVAATLTLGLVQKTSGSFLPHPTAGGVSHDVVMARTGEAWDILIDAENEARPAFNPIAPIDPHRYVAVESQPDPPPPPSPPPNDDVLGQLVLLNHTLRKLAAHLGVTD